MQKLVDRHFEDFAGDALGGVVLKRSSQMALEAAAAQDAGAADDGAAPEPPPPPAELSSVTVGGSDVEMGSVRPAERSEPGGSSSHATAEWS